MKNLFTLILSFTFMVSAFAQTPEVMKHFSHKIYMSEHFDGNKVERERRVFDFATKQKPIYKSTNTKQQQLYYYIEMGWNNETSQWENSYKSEYTYDTNGNSTTKINSEWNNKANQWGNNYKSECTYDANGNMTALRSSIWNSETRQWGNNYKTEYSYDADGNCTVEIGSFWNSDSSQWKDTEKYENTYNTNGNLTLRIHSHRKSYTSQLENASKTQYTYDTNGNLTTKIYYLWNSESSQWENTEKYEYSYDANGNRTVKMYYGLWNSITNQWINPEKYEYTYDACGNPTVEMYSYWSNIKSQWIKNYKYEYTYDLKYNIGDIILPNFYVFYHRNSIVDKPIDFVGYYYCSVDSSWVKSKKGTYYYSPGTATSVSNISSTDYTVYPNPTSEYVIFDISEPSKISKVDIFTVQGKKILTQSLINKTVDVSAFSKGIYFYQLSINGKVSSGKIVKK